jgi:hypothetical protein
MAPDWRGNDRCTVRLYVIFDGRVGSGPSPNSARRRRLAAEGADWLAGEDGCSGGRRSGAK